MVSLRVGVMLASEFRRAEGVTCVRLVVGVRRAEVLHVVGVVDAGVVETSKMVAVTDMNILDCIPQAPVPAAPANEQRSSWLSVQQQNKKS